VRPIDVIRGKIDSDLMKYHTVNLCKIDSDKDVYNLTGVGVCALVRLLTDSDDPSTFDVSKMSYFPVLILNRPYGWIEANVSRKCYVLTLNTVADRSSSLAVGFLVSQTAVADIEDFKSMRLKQKSDEHRAKQDSIKALQSKQETNQLAQS
jgi:hypothetical protein